MATLNLKKTVSAASPWITGLGIFFFGGGLLLGASFLVVAAIRAFNYTGFGESGVYDLLLWGFPLAGIGAAGLIVLVVWRLILRWIRTRRASSGQSNGPAQT